MEVKGNKLCLGKFSAKALADKFGTPIYVYEVSIIRRKYSELVKSINYPKLDIHYACKANTNLLVLKLLKSFGSKIETVSKGEIILALKAGFRAKDIIYTSTSVSKEEMTFVVKNKIRINLDSLSQIELYGKLNKGAGVGLRINQGIGAGHHDHVITGGEMSKFGISLEHLPRARRLAKKYNLKIVSLHQHIGSNILDVKILLKAFDKLLETALNFPDLVSLDFGGGLGVPYLSTEKELDLKLFGREITKRMNDFCKKYGRELTMVLEPGRFLVAQSGVLITTVTEIKKNPKRTFVGVDSGFNHLIRPAMYGSYHQIVNASQITGRKIKVDVVGNICESGDVFGRDRIISNPRIGDILIIQDTGAYGYVMASRYNSRSLPEEVLIDGSKIIS